MKAFIASMILVLSVGCSSHSGGLLQGQKFDQSRPITVAPIRDVTDTDGAVANGSGASLEAALRERLKKDGYNVGYGGYTLRVTYTLWEDHATEWNFAPDKIAAGSELVDGAYGALVASANVTASGSTLTFYAQTPARLVSDLADEIVDKTLPPMKR